MIRSHLALGSNLGDRAATLQAAVDGLAARAGVTLVATSRVYETDPVGGPVQDDFLNAVVAVDTTLDPYSLLGIAHDLEAAAERVRSERWGPRTLDVDVLRYGDCRLDDPVLTIPHPRMFERAFVLVPLADLDASLVPSGSPTAGVRATDFVLRVPEPAR
jgi:2-amino-4-hydroxy-6-hydroxymethyldihydropteridine diphosphokinase